MLQKARFKITIVIFVATYLLGCNNSKSNMPPFKLLLADSSTISSADIPKGKPIVIIFFSPDCEHCQIETKSLLPKLHNLQDVRFYFVTEDPMDRMNTFCRYYQMSKYPNVTVGRDYEFAFFKFYDVSTTPITMIYSKNKDLKITLKGPYPADSVIAAIRAI